MAWVPTLTPTASRADMDIPEPYGHDSTPTDDDRRRAVCAAMTAAPGLLRYAIRFSRCLADAEDAYQRAMEIALTKAPVVEPERFRAWLRTVIRNEALAIAGRQRREGPAFREDATQAVARVADDGPDLELRAQWRERYHSIQDALSDLNEGERMCVMLQTAGASYKAIGETTGFSPRKVERCIAEGRARLYSWELRLSEGEICDRLLEPIDRVASGQAERGDRRRVARHTRHCGSCRSLLRARRESNQWMAALVPAALVATGGLDARPPDPSHGLALVERAAAAATVRLGHLIQLGLEAPGSLGAKLAAGAVMSAVAVGAGGQALVDAIDGSTSPRPAALGAAAPTPAATPPMPRVAPPVVTPVRVRDRSQVLHRRVVIDAATVTARGYARAARTATARAPVAAAPVEPPAATPTLTASRPAPRYVAPPRASATSEFDGL